jgi:hypothetical protein
MMQGDDFASKLGGIMKEAMWLCAPLLVGLCSSLGLVPNHVVLVLGNEGGGPHMQGRHTWGLGIVLEASGFDFECSSTIQLMLYSPLYMF